MPVALGLLVSALVLAQPSVSGERAVDAPRIGAPPRLQQLLDIGFDGTNYVVLFSNQPEQTTTLSVARVSPSGALLDLDGVPVWSSPFGFQAAALSCTSAVCLVATAEYATFGRPLYLSPVTAVRLLPDLTRLDATPLTIGPPGASVLKVQNDGMDFLVAWTGDYTSFELRAARVTSTGTVLDPGGFLVSANAALPDIAWSGAAYLASWIPSAGNGLWGRRLGRDGGLLDAAPLVLGGTAAFVNTPTAAWNGQEWWVAWADTRQHAAGSDIFGGRMNAAGQLLDGTGTLISYEAAANCYRMRPRALSDGSGGTWVLWNRSTNTYLPQVDAFVGQTGANFIDSAGTVSSTDVLFGTQPTLNYSSVGVAGRGSALVGFTDYLLGPSVARVMMDGGVPDPIGVAVPRAQPRPSTEMAPAVACTADLCLAAWVDQSGREQRIWGSWLFMDGGVADPAGFELSQGDGGFFIRREAPQVASGPSDFLVAWGEVSDNGSTHTAQAVQLSYGGAMARLPTLAAFARPAVAYDPLRGAYLVAGNTGIGSPMGTYVLEPGTGTQSSFCPGCYGPLGISIAVLPGAELLVWSEYEAQVQAALLDGDGGFIGTPGFALSNTGMALRPAAVVDGQHFFVAWSEGTADGGPWRIRASHVETDASVSFGPVDVVAGARNLFDLSLAPWDGGFLMTWTDDHLGYGQSFMAQVSSAGVAGPALSLSDPALDEGSARLAVDGLGRGIVVYRRYDAPSVTTRVFFRTVGSSGPLGPGSPCMGPADCTTGSCVAGICCTGGCDAGACGGGVCGGDGGPDEAPDASGTYVPGADGGPSGDSGMPAVMLTARCGCSTGAGPLGVGLWSLGCRLRRRRRQTSTPWEATACTRAPRDPTGSS